MGLTAEEQTAVEVVSQAAAAAVQASWSRVAALRERRHEQNAAERERAGGRAPRVREARDASKIPQFAISEFI